ncbi:MAG: pilus assembly PilX family protein [Armatimonadota bacterium]
MMRAPGSREAHQRGQALLMVLVVMLIIQTVVWVFLSRVTVEQRLAGGSARGLAAFYLAEAGVQKALRMLEEGADWSLPHEELLGAGAFTVEALESLPGGLTAIVVRGEVGGTHRRLRVVCRVGPQALAYGMFAQGIATFGGQTRTYVLPYRIGSGRRAGDLAAGVEVRFDSPRTTLNAFRGARLSLRDGEVVDSALLDDTAAADPTRGVIDVVLAGPAQLVSGIVHKAVSLEDLKRQIPGLSIRRVRSRSPLAAPAVKLKAYKALAEANKANAAINAAAGLVAGESDLRGKKHSAYSVEEFEAILDYLRIRPRQPLQGVIYVDSDVLLEDGDRLAIADGALIVEGDLDIGERARLEVRHGQGSRALPGIVVWGEGTMQIEDNAVVIVDGLILAEWDVRVRAGVLDVIGAIAARNLFAMDGTVVVRYDSGVLATVGLKRTGRGLAEPVSWQEIP